MEHKHWVHNATRRMWWQQQGNTPPYCPGRHCNGQTRQWEPDPRPRHSTRPELTRR